MAAPRVEINVQALNAYTRREMEVRGRAALRLYRAEERRTDDRSYPFPKGPGPREYNVRHIPGGVRIEVMSPGAVPFEIGNDPGGGFIEAHAGSMLRIPLRSKRRSRAGRGLPGVKAFVALGDDGKPYLFTEKVRAYEGRHALERSVQKAFGLRVR